MVQIGAMMSESRIELSPSAHNSGECGEADNNESKVGDFRCHCSVALLNMKGLESMSCHSLQSVPMTHNF